MAEKEKEKKKRGTPKTANAEDVKEAREIKTKNEQLVEKNAEKIGKVLDDDAKRRKRKKWAWLLLLLLLLLFVIIASSVLAYFLVTSRRKPPQEALKVLVSGYRADGVPETEDRLIISREYTYIRGEEMDYKWNIDMGTVKLERGYYLRVDYGIDNLTDIKYSYMINFDMSIMENFEILYYTGTDESTAQPVENNRIEISMVEDFSVSVILRVKDTGQDAQLEGRIDFTIIIY